MKLFSFLNRFFSQKNTYDEYFKTEGVPYHNSREYHQSQKTKTINFRSM